MKAKRGWPGSPAGFIEVVPRPFDREIIADLQTMETGMATIFPRPFAIGQCPVTNEQFLRFIQATKYVPGDEDSLSCQMFLAHWEGGAMPPADILTHPVTFVSYDDALACALWIGGRLPRYEEWLYAAHSGRNTRFPWGDVFSPAVCNVREGGVGGTTPVGQYSPDGDSAMGCVDMVGNVWEWTSEAVGEECDLLVAMGPGWDHPSFQSEIVRDRSYRNHSVGFRVTRGACPPYE